MNSMNRIASLGVVMGWTMLVGQVHPSTAGPDSRVDSPVIGYWTRSDGTELRAMLGVPGAARLSDPIALPDGTVHADPATGAGWVLVTRAGECLALDPATGVAASIASIAPDAWTYSPSGTRLALYEAPRGRVTTYSGLPGAPKIETTVVAGTFDSWAISDSGDLALARSGVIVDGSGNQRYQSAQLGPLAFEAGSGALLVFDSASGSLIEIGPGNGAPQRVVASGFGTPSTLYGSDRVAYAGDSGAGQLWTVDLGSGSITNWNVPVSRIAASRIAGAVFVSLRGDGPVWMVGPQGITFVPALAVAGGGGGQ